MNVREAKEDDRSAISDMYYELYPEKENKGLVPVGRSKLRTITLVAEGDGKVAGFILGNYIEYGFSKYGYIEELFTRKDSRGKGIGSTLIKAMLDRFKEMDVDAVLVTTDEGIGGAVEFYKKLGFKMCQGPWLYWSHKD